MKYVLLMMAALAKSGRIISGIVLSRFTLIAISLLAILSSILAIFHYANEILPAALVPGSVKPFNSQMYGQTIGQMSASLIDTNLTILMGLYAVVAFAIHHDPDHTRFSLRYKIIPGCILVISSISSIFFAIKFKASLMLQIQHDQINIERLDSIFDLHLVSLFVSGACSLTILGFSVVAQRGKS